MPTNKRARKKTYKQARAEAEAAARRRAHRRRQVTTLAVIVGAVIVIAGVVLFTGGDDGKDVASENTSSVPTEGSAAGKSCVPVADPLPPGSPPVEVAVGPPPTELIKTDIKVGTGAEVSPTSNLTVNYTGVACSTGKIFDSSYERGQPAMFALSGVIKGWQEGIPGMKVGGQRLLGIPSDLAYGPVGSPPDIAPDEVLWFVVEIVGVT